MSSYSLNESIPSHDIEEHQDTKETQFDSLNTVAIADYNSVLSINKDPTQQKHAQVHDMTHRTTKHKNDDTESVLSRVIARSKIISEVLQATYGASTTYVRYAKKEEEGGIDDDLCSVLMQKEFETGKRVKFGTWDGVFARCLLNIFGVIMYLRVGFIVGEAGIFEALLIIISASIITLITTLSMSALCTNGIVLGGGAYYFISRVMGPSIGGSVGLVFTVGNMLAVSLYIIGFAETINQNISDETDGWIIVEHEVNAVRIWSNIILIGTFILAYIGLSVVIKTQLMLLCLIMISLILYFIGSIYKTEDGILYGIDGWWNGNFTKNFHAEYESGWNFWTVFAIFFPAVTGIMAGANISGDLKRPHIDIPKGTLWSIGLSTIIYILLVLVTGAVVVRDELKTNNLVMADICAWNYILLLGIYAATLSSAIASLVGAPRILQAISLDLANDCFPFIKYFEVESKSGEPIRGYILTCIVTFIGNCIGELNEVAQLISQFFMLTYAMMNFACFWCEIYPLPDKKQWNPKFKFYNRWLSLFGAVSVVFVMIIMNIYYAIAAILITMALYAWIEFCNPKTQYVVIKRFYIGKEFKNFICYLMCCCGLFDLCKGRNRKKLQSNQSMELLDEK
eukprot:142500_1